MISWPEITAVCLLFFIFGLFALGTLPKVSTLFQISFLVNLALFPIMITTGILSRGSDHSGLTGSSRRRYLKRVTGGQDLGAKARRFVALPRLDITNVLAGGILGVILTLILALTTGAR
jgi:hypothetical protein